MQCRFASTQRDELAIELAELRAPRLLETIPSQHGGRERRRVARVGPRAAEVVGVLGHPSSSHRLEEVRVAMVDEVGEGCHLAIFLAHEEEG